MFRRAARTFVHMLFHSRSHAPRGNARVRRSASRPAPDRYPAASRSGRRASRRAYPRGAWGRVSTCYFPIFYFLLEKTREGVLDSLLPVVFSFHLSEDNHVDKLSRSVPTFRLWLVWKPAPL